MVKTLLPMVGVIPAMNISFHADDRLDLDGLQRHLDYAVKEGVAGIMIPVVASEVLTLTPKERADIMAATVEAVDHRVPIIGGATAETKEQCLSYVRELTEAGCEGVLANIPFENEEQYTNYVWDIDRCHPGFLMIQDYNIQASGVPVEVLIKLYNEVPSFKSLKIETNLPGPKFTAVLKATGGQLNVAGGWSITQYIEALDRGVHCMVPTGMHEIFCKLDKLYRDGHRDKAMVLYQRVQPIIAFSNQDPNISRFFYKRLLWKQGYYASPHVRALYMQIDEYYERIADDMIELFFQISDEVRAGKYD